MAQAHQAASRGAWDEAWRAVCDEGTSDLGAGDLDFLADAAWWTRHTERSMELRRLAYARHAEADDARAAHCAWFLWFDHRSRGQEAIASGWLARAERHARAAGDTPEVGMVLLARAETARVAGDRPTAIRCCEHALHLGQLVGASDVVTLAIQIRGCILLDAGDSAGGLQCLDDAMVSVLADDLRPLVAGLIFCNVLGACMEIGDVERAAEWSDAAMAWCERHPGGTPYLGVCQLHRVHLATLRGDWDRAESDATGAVENLEGEASAAALAQYELGEVCRHRGDLDRAEGHYRRALELGLDPMPGLAQLRLCQGRVDDAVTGIVHSSVPDGPPLARAEALAAHVEIHVTACDLTAARHALDLLEALDTEVDSLAITATAATARTRLALAVGDVGAAVQAGQAARTAWQRLRAPYWAARMTVLVGLARRQAGDLDSSRLALEAARDAFERLGARGDVRAVRTLLEPPEDASPLTPREVEVLRLVAGGRTNRQVAEELVLSRHTVSRHLQNIFARLGVSSRAAATARAHELGLL